MVGGDAAFTIERVQKLAHNLSPHAEEAPKTPSRSTRASREPHGASFETPISWAPQDEDEAFEKHLQCDVPWRNPDATRPSELTELDIKEVGLDDTCRHAYRLGSRIYCLPQFRCLLRRNVDGNARRRSREDWRKGFAG